MPLADEFLSAALTAEGAIVEADADGLYVLLPPDAAAALHLPEVVRIRTAGGGGAPAPVPAVLDGRIGSTLIERLAARRLTRPPMAALVLPAELPRPLPDHLPVLRNAVRAGEPRRGREVSRYLEVVLRLTLQSDEVRRRTERVTLRLADGARVTPLPIGRGEARPLALLTNDERRCARRALHEWLARDGLQRMTGPLEAVQRRVRRDLERLAEFFASLDGEMQAAARRARSAEERARRTEKRRMLPADLAARRAQVAERLRPRLSAAVVASVLAETDVERFEVPVRRRTRSGAVHVLCRSADTIFEGPACAACGGATLHLYLCDERLHVLCDGCGRGGRLDASRCPACRRAPVPPPSVTVDDPTEPVRQRLAPDAGTAT